MIGRVRVPVASQAMTRYIVYGAGAVGGTVGICLSESGHDVALVARGAHGAAIRSDGLRLDTPERSVTLSLPVTDDIATLRPGKDDVILLAVKSQDTDSVLNAIAGCAGAGVAVVCLQNGVANERRALRYVPDVYAVPVILPAEHVEPGVVIANCAPVTAILDVGRYPSGVDDRAEEIAQAFRSSTFDSRVLPDVLRWKYRKLQSNLANAVEALIGDVPAAENLIDRARAEADAVLAAAGIDVATTREDRERRGGVLRAAPVNGQDRRGGSTWQSLYRGAAVETDFLNGEIALLGRLHGVPTPVNTLLQHEMRRAVREGIVPGSIDPNDLLSRLD